MSEQSLVDELYGALREHRATVHWCTGAGCMCCRTHNAISRYIRERTSSPGEPTYGELLTIVADTQSKLFTATMRVAELLAALRGLIAGSNGVAGLHLNGDVATWDELCDGGLFEEWLGLPMTNAQEFLNSVAALSTPSDGEKASE